MTTPEKKEEEQQQEEQKYRWNEGRRIKNRDKATRQEDKRLDGNTYDRREIR